MKCTVWWTCGNCGCSAAHSSQADVPSLYHCKWFNSVEEATLFMMGGTVMGEFVLTHDIPLERAACVAFDEKDEPADADLGRLIRFEKTHG